MFKFALKLFSKSFLKSCTTFLSQNFQEIAGWNAIHILCKKCEYIPLCFWQWAGWKELECTIRLVQLPPPPSHLRQNHWWKEKNKSKMSSLGIFTLPFIHVKPVTCKIHIKLTAKAWSQKHSGTKTNNFWFHFSNNFWSPPRKVTLKESKMIIISFTKSSFISR